VNIETVIAANTAALASHEAALKENTAALLQVLAASGATTPAAAPAPAAKKPTKAAKLEVVEAAQAHAEVKDGATVVILEEVKSPEPVVEAAPEPEAPAATEPEPEADPAPEPEPTETPEGFNRDEVLLEVQQAVKAWVKASGANMVNCIKTYETLRAKYGVKNVTELDDANLAKIKVEIDAMIAAN